MKKLFYLMLIAVLTLCACAEAYGATYDDSYFDDDTYLAVNVVYDSPPEKVIKEKPINHSAGMSDESIEYFLAWTGFLFILFGFFLFMKYTFLVLQLTEYEKFVEDMHLQDKEVPPGYYPLIKPSRYILDFKSYTLRDILDSFTYIEYVEWKKEYYA